MSEHAVDSRTGLPVRLQDAELMRLMDQAATLRAEAATLPVTSDEERDFVVVYLGEIATVKKLAETRQKALVAPLQAQIEPLSDQVAAIKGAVKSLLAPILEADTLLRGRLLAYQQAQARKVEEERQRLEALRREAEAEARRQEAEAARQRQVAERLAAEDQAAARAALEEARRAEQEAITRRLEASKPVVLPPVLKTVQTGMGSTTVRKDWDFEVTDLRALLSAVAEDNSSGVMMAWISINRSAVLASIRTGLRQAPGLRIFQAESLTVKPGR